MDTTRLIRRLIGLRTRDRVSGADVSRMSAAQLRARPEATIVAIVHGWFEFRSNGYGEADILREIQGRRALEYGDEPLPADLNLESYVRYRMRLEHPGETALHDSVYTMQAVHLVAQAFEDEYGPHGEAPGLRSLSAAMMSILLYVAFVAFLQGGFNVLRLVKPARPGEPWVSAILLAVAAILVVAAIGFLGRAAWGRIAMLLALAMEIVIGWCCVAHILLGRNDGPPALAWMQSVNTLLALAAFAYVYRSADARRLLPAVRDERSEGNPAR